MAAQGLLPHQVLPLLLTAVLTSSQHRGYPPSKRKVSSGCARVFYTLIGLVVQYTSTGTGVKL